MTDKSENERLKEWCRALIESEEIAALKAALWRIRKAVLNDSRKSYIDDVARRALGGTK
jgi:hypothetical protein